MKNLKNISIFVAIFLMSACVNHTSEPYNYECPRPADIPETYASGQPVPWDCNWNAYYKEGRVTVIRDSLGNAVALVKYKTKSK
jgi:hypothetical protein